jgi:glycosyltransferase involved in cell wall biosynthesis
LNQSVTLIGAGRQIAGRPYRFIHAGCVGRGWFAKFPRLPFLRSPYAYEELTFAPNLWRQFYPADYDVTVTCGFPYCNWVLRTDGTRISDAAFTPSPRTQGEGRGEGSLDRAKHLREPEMHPHPSPLPEYMERGPERNHRRPAHVFVTQNGDHVLCSKKIDYRSFACDGLVCTNPQIYDRHKSGWPSALIPNGVDTAAFVPGAGDRAQFGLPTPGPIILTVSALIPSKRIPEAVRAVSKIKDVALVVAGDGELRSQIQSLGSDLLPGRFFLLHLPRERMPALYRCADMVLHAGLDEPSAHVYVEALATGLAVVAHDTAVTRWTFEQAGFLVDAGDENALVGAIEQALGAKSPQQIAARRELAERRFAWLRIARQYLDFFHQVIDPW